MPELSQIRHYFKNLRTRLGDNNNIEDIKAFVDTLEHKPGTTPDDELFVFGKEIGTLTKWSADPVLSAQAEPDPDADDPESETKSFVEYFKAQWVESQFHRWQLFWTGPGMAHTNSPIESYNK